MKVKDLKLLEHLDINSRANLGYLAKQIGISKQAISMKIKSLKNSKIIEFVTIVDFFKLGYSNAHLYLKLKSMKRKDYEKKLNLIREIKNVTWISEFIGEYDLGISIFYKNLKELSNILKKIYTTLDEDIKIKQLHLIKNHEYSNLSITEKSKNNSIKIEDEDIQIHLTQTQKDLLKQLESNARATYSEIADKLNVSIPSIKYNIKKLEKEGIIKAYKTLLNYNSLGYIWNLCIIEPEEKVNKTSLINLLRNGCLSPFISLTIEGTIIIDFLTKDYNELKYFLNKIGSTTNNKIRAYKILNVNKIIKLKNVFD